MEGLGWYRGQVTSWRDLAGTDRDWAGKGSVQAPACQQHTQAMNENCCPLQVAAAPPAGTPPPQSVAVRDLPSQHAPLSSAPGRGPAPDPVVQGCKLQGHGCHWPEKSDFLFLLHPPVPRHTHPLGETGQPQPHLSLSPRYPREPEKHHHHEGLYQPEGGGDTANDSPQSLPQRKRPSPEEILQA